MKVLPMKGRLKKGNPQACVDRYRDRPMKKEGCYRLEDARLATKIFSQDVNR